MSDQSFLLLLAFAIASSLPAQPPQGPPCFGRRYAKNDVIARKNDPKFPEHLAQCGAGFLLDTPTEKELRAAGVPDSILRILPRPPAQQPHNPDPVVPPPNPRKKTEPSKPRQQDLPATPSNTPTWTTKVNSRDGLTYVWINPGTFTMGCSSGDTECDADEKKRTLVTLTEGFWIGQTEVTQSAYAKLTRGKDPSNFKGPNLPVEQVSWSEAGSFCQAAGMRLPWEREWEYAARAGTSSRYLDQNLDEIAWYDKTSGGKTHDVASKKPNAWGLHDMLGNVWEWVEDTYADYPGGRVQGARGPDGTGNKVLRGGAWLSVPRLLRVSLRNPNVPSLHLHSIGFRCAGTTIP